MNAGQILKASEASALRGGDFLTKVTGKKLNIKKSKKIKSFGAVGFITVLLAFFLVIFSSGNLMPSMLSDALINEFDVQRADAIESKKIVIQRALEQGNLPEDTVKILKNNGVLTGYVKDGDFIETNQHDGGLVLKIDNNIITPNTFINEMNYNSKLFDAIDKATYSGIAYWYDDSAKEVMRKIGTTRNNYTENSDFDEVMEKKISTGSDVYVNSVSLVKKTRVNEKTGKEETYTVYEENGNTINSKTSAENFVTEVSEKSLANSTNEATLNSADILKVADTISKEQRSSLFFLVFMENISKMKAGEGNASKINEAMNYLYSSAETEIVDVKTGEIIKTTGTALESPSLYAVLSGEKIDATKIQNYSSDRILKTVENQLGENTNSVIAGTVTSSSNKIKGSIGRLVNNGSESASKIVLDSVTPTVSSSLIDNSYKTIKGISAGEFLVEGAINVGKSLAKASGATAGDTEATLKYAKLNNTVLAMEAKIDRMNRSPFDITSKNTFLGSIFYKIATFSNKNFGSWYSGIKTFGNILSQSLISFLPSSYADSTNGYLSTFGDCETYKTIGAVGSAQCSEIAVFDTSTLEDPFHNSEFINFVENNTTLSSSGVRTINQNSDLADFIKYNNERITPLGVIDGGILESLKNGSSKISFSSDILEMIKTWLSSSDADKRIASGEVFVNSSQNEAWQKKYKYAQRYVSLARATAVLKQYSNDPLAYNNIKFFEGSRNPVMAFLEEYYAMNQ